MLTVPTALLRHRTPAGDHYDWLMGQPDYATDPGSGLWTARIAVASWDWHDEGSFLLQRLPDHRRAYLSYQGPISGGRGEVVRVDEGSVGLASVADGRMICRVRLQRFQGTLALDRVHGDRWRGRVSD